MRIREQYIISSTNDRYFKAVVASASRISPIDYIDNIQKDLFDLGCDNGNIIFDLLLSHGLTNKNRFFVGFYNESKIKNIKRIYRPELINRETIEFFNKNQDYLEDSVLTEHQKFLMKLPRKNLNDITHGYATQKIMEL